MKITISWVETNYSSWIAVSGAGANNAALYTRLIGLTIPEAVQTLVGEGWTVTKQDDGRAELENESLS